MWLVIGSGMVTLLAAAMRKQKSERCSGYSITIVGKEKNIFIDEREVLRMMAEGVKGKLKGQRVALIDLRSLEQKLENNVWIRDAELYFDNNAVLHVTITERVPIARLFNSSGKSFYLDKEGKLLPLPEKLRTVVPVFTGFTGGKKLTRKDKKVLEEISTAANFINENPFWTAQVAQIDITDKGELEMVPAVGNHIVKLGKGDYVEKFRRLFVFYRNVLSKTGFDKYQSIDVRFAGQVIGVKGNVSQVDSKQLKRSVEDLMKLAQDIENNSYMPVVASPGIEAKTEPGQENNFQPLP